MKRASAALAALSEPEMESGELTDSDDEGTSEGRRRSKKKKHRHDKEYWNAKKQRKKEKKDKEHRKKEKERRERRPEDGGSTCGEHPSNSSAGREAPTEKKATDSNDPAAQRRLSDASDGKAAKRTMEEEAFGTKSAQTKDNSPIATPPPHASSSGLKSSKLPRVPKLPPCSSVGSRNAKGPKAPVPSTKACKASATEAKGDSQRIKSASECQNEPVGPQSQAVAPVSHTSFSDDLSDDEMSEADLCIVEETGECPDDNQDSLLVVDEFVLESSDEKMETEKEAKGTDDEDKVEERRNSESAEEVNKEADPKEISSENETTSSKTLLTIRAANSSATATVAKVSFFTRKFCHSFSPS